MPKNWLTLGNNFAATGSAATSARPAHIAAAVRDVPADIQRQLRRRSRRSGDSLAAVRRVDDGLQVRRRVHLPWRQQQLRQQPVRPGLPSLQGNRAPGTQPRAGAYAAHQLRLRHQHRAGRAARSGLPGEWLHVQPRQCAAEPALPHRRLDVTNLGTKNGGLPGDVYVGLLQPAAPESSAIRPAPPTSWS